MDEKSVIALAHNQDEVICLTEYGFMSHELYCLFTRSEMPAVT